MNAGRALAMFLAVVAGLPALAGGYTGTTNFVLRCSGCHGLDGAGSENAGIPDLRGYVDGLASTADGRRYLIHVPGMRNVPLDAAETAEVMNYVLGRFSSADRGPDAPDFTPAEVARLRGIPTPDVVGLRRQVAADLLARGLPVAGYPWP